MKSAQARVVDSLCRGGRAGRFQEAVTKMATSGPFFAQEKPLRCTRIYAAYI